MSQKIKNKILPQMFDVRPVNAQGDLDLEKINRIKIASRIQSKIRIKPISDQARNGASNIARLKLVEDEKKRFRRVIQKEQERRNQLKLKEELFIKQEIEKNREQQLLEFKKQEIKARKEQEKKQAQLKKRAYKKAIKKQRLLVWLNSFRQFRNQFYSSISFRKKLGVVHNYHYFEKKDRKKYSFSFLGVACVVFLLIFGFSFFYRGISIRGLAIENGKIAYANLSQAKDEIKSHNFNGASISFDEAYKQFGEIQNNVNSLGEIIIETSRFIPYLSKLSSGSHLAQAGKNIAKIGELSSITLETLNKIKNPLKNSESVSLLKIFQDSNKNIEEIYANLCELKNNLDKINMEDIPENQRSKFIDLKQQLPEINKFILSFSQEEKILTDVLGGNGQRKYLFLFQNNQEMRATGGFIGTYAVLDIFNGNIKNFFVDGIFNPDGQLREKVIPPDPIQKISAAWSLHDSNWFPNFPTSAEKASWFYEKTGGPTVDGVITMTPTVMKNLLEITGPIEMPEYNLTIDKDNFLENIQTEVETNYDKELNQPKKILADLAPKILDRIFNAHNITDLTKTMDAILTSLNEKQILIYSKNYEIEKILSENGWSGEVLDTRKDYLSIINTNINGYKTDGVIDESISHKSVIQADGSIVDTVSITRHHNGGDTPYDWWNKVNADYMRVYVPKGAKLIHVSGQTREFDVPPLDYKALGFKSDPQIEIENDSATIDNESGTKIYEDSGKTVFANWIYVSPKESATITYSYLLPFKLDTDLIVNPADAYSILFQKQSGSLGSQFFSDIIYPDFYNIIWKYPENISINFNATEGKREIKFEGKLNTDKFIGVAFGKNQ